MPVQRLDRCPPAAFVPERRGGNGKRAFWARIAMFAMAAALTGYGVWEMLGIVGFGGATVLQLLLAALFALNFGWIAVGAANALIGFYAYLTQPQATSVADRPVATRNRTALVMPIYNEDPEAVFPALERMGEALADSVLRRRLEIFILSDSTDPRLGMLELRLAGNLALRLAGKVNVHYRRRDDNTGRKAGNIADFVRRWGGRYDYMIVLDADSYMTREAIVSLVHAMDVDPEAGLIQAPTRLAFRRTLFARMQQFAAAVYGEISAAGAALWQGHDGNFNGHNAIIRVEAFAACCGLPELPGAKPFGGHIMSHDFVEAALLKRAGWKVYHKPELAGSYEQSPPNIIDFAKRDRRWTQGNLQHARVLSADGLHWMSRLHMTFGIASYLSSVLWFLFLATGMLISVFASFAQLDYFPEPHSLFPSWPHFDSERALALIAFALVVLLTPKLLGLISVALAPDRRAAAGGLIPLVLSVFLETLVSALLAPVMMLIHTRHVVEIMLARDSGWDQQQRDDTEVSLGDGLRLLWLPTLTGLALAVATAALNLALFLWLLPIWLGLVLAAPVAWLTSLRWAGETARDQGLFLIEEERFALPPAEVPRAALSAPGSN